MHMNRQSFCRDDIHSPPLIRFYQSQDIEGNIRTYLIKKETLEDIRISRNVSERMQDGSRIVPVGTNTFLIITHNRDGPDPYVSRTLISIEDLSECGSG